MNIIIHGVEEDAGTVWETREKTTAKFYDFLKSGLKFDNPHVIQPIRSTSIASASRVKRWIEN